jgi:opacity protein-like surface antigen
MQTLREKMVGWGSLALILSCLASYSESIAFGQDTTQSNSTAKTVPPEEYPDLIEIDPFGGVSIWGQVNKGLGEKLITGGTAGARVAVNVSSHLGIEFSYNFSVNNVRLVTPIRPGLPSYNFGNQIHEYSLNPVYNITPRGSRVQPYVTVGVSLLRFVPTDQAKATARSAADLAIYNAGGLRSNTQVGLNYGGGVKFHISDHIGLRFDVRGIYSKAPTFGLPNFNNNGVYISRATINGLQATAGLVFYLGSKPVPPAPPPVKPPPAPLNAGDITGATGTLCQGKPISLHSSASDPEGHALTYAWKLNDAAAGGNSPDFSFTPNNGGDFKVEVTVTDSTDPNRKVTAGPKTISVQEYAAPQISSVTASPQTSSCSADPNGPHTANLSAQVTGSACGGNLTYKWTVTEGSVSNDTNASAVFDASTLNFESGGGGQSKTVTATLTATDESGKAATQTTTITVNCPPQFKRLPDIVFAKNGARVNNCGKRILIDQAAPQSGTNYDILLVAHRSADERERVAGARGGRRNASRTLDEQRALNAAAVLAGGKGTCASVDAASIKIDAVGTDQTSTPDPGLCGTSNLPQTKERRGSQVSDADKERRVEVYLVPKNSQTLPPAAKNARPVPETDMKALGCPR